MVWKPFEVRGDWKRFEVRGYKADVESEDAGADPLTLRVFGWGEGWRTELYKGYSLHRATSFPGSSPELDAVLKDAERWSHDAKRSYNGWRGGWNTWHLSLESDNDQDYYNAYMDLVKEYNDALADNPDFNQEAIREALSRHWLMIMKNSDADYIVHQINFGELWEHFLSDAKESKEYDN